VGQDCPFQRPQLSYQWRVHPNSFPCTIINNAIVDDFVTQLLLLPPETEIISDSVYANSQTLDGRRFAEEFVRRRKLADKGIVEGADQGKGNFVPVSAGDQKSSSGGWSEVAKKGPAVGEKEKGKEMMGAEFRMVAGKKKGRK
jgi:PERQ amino acid-rich with GYF domain-containing protein